MFIYYIALSVFLYLSKQYIKMFWKTTWEPECGFVSFKHFKNSENTLRTLKTVYSDLEYCTLYPHIFLQVAYMSES